MPTSDAEIKSCDQHREGKSSVFTLLGPVASLAKHAGRGIPDALARKAGSQARGLLSQIPHLCQPPALASTHLRRTTYR
jgi:hypothetical protein